VPFSHSLSCFTLRDSPALGPLLTRSPSLGRTDRPALSKLTVSLHKTIVHLDASWELELARAVSIDLRRTAQNHADRAAWHELQWRAEAFRSGMRATADAARRLARETARFLDGVRGRVGLLSR